MEFDDLFFHLEEFILEFDDIVTDSERVVGLNEELNAILSSNQLEPLTVPSTRELCRTIRGWLETAVLAENQELFRYLRRINEGV